jgi:hypothetical protein
MMERSRDEHPNGAAALSLQTLRALWPVPCPECADQPAIVCIPDADAPVPEFQVGACRRCGRFLYSTPILVGVDCEAI